MSILIVILLRWCKALERAGIRVASIAHRLDAWCRRRLERRVMRQPRLWQLVGGAVVSEMSASGLVHRQYPDAWRVRRDDGLERWFVGVCPVAEHVPDPDRHGFVRLFVKGGAA